MYSVIWESEKANWEVLQTNLKNIQNHFKYQ